MNENFKKFLEEKNITVEDFAKKDAEGIAGLYNEYNQKSLDAITELAKKDAEVNAKAISELEKSLNNDRVEQMKSLNAQIEQMGMTIKKLSKKESEEAAKQINSVSKGLEANKELLTKMAEGENVKLSFKAVGTMLESTNISGGNVPVEQRLAGMNPIASRRIRLMDIVNRGTAESNIISWVYQSGKEGAAGGTTEGALKNQIDFDLVVESESLKKRTAFIKISEEMLTDIPFMNSEINNELMREVMKDIEAQVYEGDDTGNNLNGIRTVATAFAAGTFASSVDNANMVDVLRVAMNQIMIANHEGANFILAYPSDVTALKLIKASTTDKRYIDALQIVAGQLLLDGVPIIESTLVTADEYLVGNFDLATVYDKGSISIEVGRDSDDFTKNLVTVLAEWRGLVIVKNNDRTAFIKGVISTDAAALETP